MGDATKEIKIFPIPLTCSAYGPTEINTAPIIPPIRACEEELGIPYHQVKRFQKIAPTKAATMISPLIISGAVTISPPMVFATPVLIIAPKKFNVAAIIMAVFGAMALVDTDVAMAFAVSWNPLI